MSNNKKYTLTKIIEINKLFENIGSNENNKNSKVKNIINEVFENDLNIYKKKVLNTIINNILYKKNIDDSEKNIILYIIDKINDKKNDIIIYYDILINIIDTIYLRKLMSNEKNEIINYIYTNFDELRSYIQFASFRI